MLNSIAMSVLLKLDEEGYSVPHAIDLCQKAGGVLVSSPKPPPNKLWLLFAFKDGSLLRLHPHGFSCENRTATHNRPIKAQHEKRPMIKDLNEYQKLAIRTMAPAATQDLLITHCSMGMVGEVGEYVELPAQKAEKRMGETGDAMWYAANLAHTLGMTMSHLIDVYAPSVPDDMSDFQPMERCQLWAARLLDIAKKNLFYGKPYNLIEVSDHLYWYFRALVEECLHVNIGLLQAGESNILKLEKRYPNLRFDAQDAINRDYSAESKAAGIEIG